MKTKTSLETSRNSSISRLRPCPDDLAKILEVLNLIPRTLRLPDLQKRIARFAAKRPGITAVERYMHVHELLSESLKGTPEEFQQSVWEGSRSEVSNSFKQLIRTFFVKGSPETSRERILDELLEGDDDVLDDIYFGTIDDAVREYTFIRESHDKLKKIIGMAERRNTWLRLVYPLETSGTINVNEHGIVEISHDRFAAAVAGVDATLLRECQICKRIFWASRKDKNSCSPACAHVLRNRRYRERYKEGFYQGGEAHSERQVQCETKRITASSERKSKKIYNGE